MAHGGPVVLNQFHLADILSPLHPDEISLTVSMVRFAVNSAGWTEPFSRGVHRVVTAFFTFLEYNIPIY